MSSAASQKQPLNQGNNRGERFALASAGVPFRLKVAVVWVVIFALLAGLFVAAQFDTQWMRDNARYIAAGVKFTMILAVSGIALAIPLAALGALGRLSSNSIAYGISGFYVSFFRGTPLILQMFLLYLAMPQVANNIVANHPSIPAGLASPFTLDALVAGSLALGFNYGAYMTEIFRAGIQSVNQGQFEAAEALGMTYIQKMRRVVLPQAFRVIIPPTGNEFIAMMKDTALVSFLGVSFGTEELFRRAQVVGKADFKNLEAYVVVACFYWALTAIFTFFQRRLESRLLQGYVREGGPVIPSRHKPSVVDRRGQPSGGAFMGGGS